MADQSSTELLEIQPLSPTASNRSSNLPSTPNGHDSEQNSQSSRSRLIGPALPEGTVESDSQTAPTTDTSTNKPPYMSYQARLVYQSKKLFRHRDSLGRMVHGRRDDRLISSTDGRLVPLVVMSTRKVLESKAEATWKRTGLVDDIPGILRVMFWASGPYVKQDVTSSTTFGDGATSTTWLAGRNPLPKSWLEKAQVRVETGFKYSVGALTIVVLLCFPANLGGEIRNHGQYEPFKYHYWGYAPISSNQFECPTLPKKLVTGSSLQDPASERRLKPRTLCFLREGRGIDVWEVEEWEKEHGYTRAPQYIVVAYTTAQFSHDWIDDPDGHYTAPEALDASSDDLEALSDIAETAARRAGVDAYWVACSCMTDQKFLSNDLYTLSDVIRGAHSVVIALGPSVEDRESCLLDKRELLREWGQRMWTFPEVLLSPNTHPISVYIRNEGRELGEPWEIRKRNFAAEAWADAPLSRYLIDHYEGSVILSPLELVTIAFRCLSNRQKRVFCDADIAYVLMGLLRRRPRVDSKNSAFQAFARLSISNDSDQLLERLICLLPKSRGEEWYNISDVWERNLWDVDPFCQIVGVCQEDSVVLSGAFGASIRWRRFKAVSVTHRNTAGRFLSRVILRSLPAWLLTAAIFLAIGARTHTAESESDNTYTVIGAILMGISVLLTAVSPLMIHSLYMGKVWSAQPWLFGFEGYLPISEIETLVFGSDMKRLTWTPYSSQLSRHCEVDKECIGVDPTEDPDIRDIVERSSYAKLGEPRIFTLVDTFTMTVTLFQAVRPPVSLLLCGSEGGMYRGLLCSYDWPSQTLIRETVLRVDTRALDKMPRVGRIRIGLKKEPDLTEPLYTFVNNDANPA